MGTTKVEIIIKIDGEITRGGEQGTSVELGVRRERQCTPREQGA